MTTPRNSPLQINKADFKKTGHQLIDTVAEFFDTIDRLPVTTGESPKQLQRFIGNAPMPEKSSSPDEILSRATELLFRHSLLNGHPKFHGYITSSPAPIGALADLLASAVNPNVGANILSPMATEIEKQTIRWLAQFIGIPATCGGLLVSGGNMANFTAFLAGRTAKQPKEVKEGGLDQASQKLTVYCSKTTHTWIEKAVVLFGLGAKSIRWISTGKDDKMDNNLLEQTIKDDLKSGFKPIMIIGTAGDVSMGAVDDLKGIGAICKKYNCWFHVDGAYGLPAAVIPELKPVFDGITEADSIALDPHKWLYSPLEAGCTLVKDPNHLIETFSSHPVYYNFSNAEPMTQNYYEYGLQNSRGFRALKVWAGLQHMGRMGYVKSIGEDIALSKLLFKLADEHPELEAVTQHLSITTFRYVPKDLKEEGERRDEYLNTLNENLLNTLQAGGELFLSNSVVNGKYCLRSCIVNFRTTEEHIKEIVACVVREGRRVKL